MSAPIWKQVDAEQWEGVSTRLEQKQLVPADYALLKELIDTLAHVRQLLENTKLSVKRLKQLLFGIKTEKTSQVLSTHSANEDPPKKKKKRKGHGRRKRREYTGAIKLEVPHQELMAGTACPEDCGGKLYDTKNPGLLIRLVGHPPVTGRIYETQKLRCARCGKLFEASAPAEAGTQKYDPNVAVTLGVFRYGYGLPLNRMEQMQADFGVPLPAGTQWDLVGSCADELKPAWDHLMEEAACGDLFHNDDTTARILSLQKEIKIDKANQSKRPSDADPLRTGLFTTGIISIKGSRTIALFFSGRKHAGENLQRVLDKRPPALAPPIQMCDGLDRNHPKGTKTVPAHCNAHGRRGFVEVAGSFPDAAELVLETFKKVYTYDAEAREQQMNDAERLAHHQRYSAPPMKALKEWMDEQMDHKLVEPNSGLGKAIIYELKRWKSLTRFLSVPGAPLDNNICERMLKAAIRHRKNSLFYKTERGALIGDLFMSLIHTCHLAGVNSIDYLTQLRRYATKLREAPSLWMPWTYQSTMAKISPNQRVD